MTEPSGEFNVLYVLRALRRRLPIFILCVVLAPAAAVGLSLLQHKEYTANASLLFRDPEFDQKLFGASFVQSQTDPNREAATNLSLVTLQRVARLTASHLRGVSESQVRSDVSASNTGQSDLVSIQATASTPRLAAKLANTFATTYIRFRRDADRAKIVSAEEPLRRQVASLPPHLRDGTLGQSLQQRVSQLSVLAALQTGNAEQVQSAELPSSPSSPKPLRNGVFGLLFGILLGLALAVLAEALDRRMRDPGEVEHIFARPLLAVLPESSALTHPDPGLLGIPPTDREAFSMLWVNLRYFSLSRNIRSVLVTSANRDDGKSTVAWGLAVAAASAGSRTLLIEADLRNPSFGRRFELPAQGGLTSVLAEDLSREEATIQLPLPVHEDDSNPTRAMDVLLAGPRPPDPTDLLQSPRMAEFLREVEEKYDLVVVDTPPAGIVSDAISLITLVRGVIVVSRLRNTIRDHARRLRQQLDYLDAPLLGVVVNAVEGPDTYGYSYGYGYGDVPAAAGSWNGADAVAGDEAATSSAPRATVTSADRVSPPDPQTQAPLTKSSGLGEAAVTPAGSASRRGASGEIRVQNGERPIPSRRRRLRDLLR